MRFAKLFIFGDGQLLVTRECSAAADYDEQPYLLVTETRDVAGSGVTTKMEHLYPLQVMRDADFERLEAADAFKLYTNQQAFMARMGEPSRVAPSPMHFAKLFDFDGRDDWPQGQLLAEVHESDARADADAPYQIVLKTSSPYGRIMTLAYSYADEATRDAEFEGLVPLAAEGHYRHMQAELRHATAA